MNGLEERVGDELVCNPVGICEEVRKALDRGVGYCSKMGDSLSVVHGERFDYLLYSWWMYRELTSV